MNKKEAKQIVPKLRFPEFQDGTLWVEDTIGNVCKSFSGATPSTEHKEYYGGNIPFIRSAEIDKEVTELFLTDEGLKNSSAKLIYKGDVLVALYGANSGEVALAKQEGAINQAILCLRSRDNNSFIYQYLLFKKSWIVSKYLQGGQGNLSGDIIKSIGIQIPKPDEQQKIADCLSSIDDLISAEGQKLDALKVYKKGLTQQIFPAEGEKVPKVRFSEFRDTDEWEEKELELLSLKVSDGIHTTPVYDNNGEYYFINGNNLVGGIISMDENTKKVSEEEYKKHKKDLSQNTILLSINGTIGNISVYSNEKVILGKSACYINIDENNSNRNFIINFLQTEKVNKYFDSEVTGSTIKNLSLKTIKNTIIDLPSKQEQQKIADCLSSLDEFISAQRQRVEALELHKKGLLQGLFPTMIVEK